MAERAPSIRTPDQRIRVFVSSTLKELEPERAAVRAAIEQLRLAPVMFELGARPHPPRDLYRSYLAQSDVFVGIYGESYGWVAPDEELSGLEDEYRLSTDLPSLIYIKEPAPDRNERLAGLLDRIRADDRSSWKTFSTPDELARLVSGDLATLLAERFDAARAEDTIVATAPAPEIPAPYSAIVGRERERAEVAALLGQDGVRLVTLVGPGGIGKSRLAIEIAMDVAATGRDVAFALLEAVAAPSGALVAIARALGVRNAEGTGTLLEKVIASLAGRDVLLVVDNMEHLLDASGLLVDLITESPQLTLLVTSRTALRVRAEHLYEVGPLELPSESAPDSEAAAASAVALFVARATSVRPGFELTPENLATVVAICRAVDGVPLAIELAAARVRSLSVGQILERLDSALTLLVGGARDLPERQRALRSTIRWSVDLLDTDTRAALARLSVFTGSFSLGSAESVLAATGILNPLGALESLVDASLIGTTDRHGVTTFRLLSLVRAYAAELLTPEESTTTIDAWLRNTERWRSRRSPDCEAPTRSIGSSLWSARPRTSRRGARAFERRDLETAAEYLWSLYLYLWIGGYLGVVRTWGEELLELAAAETRAIGPEARAIGEYYESAVRFWQEPGFDVVPGLTLSRDLFREADDSFGASLAGISLGFALLSRPTPDIAAALSELETSLAGFSETGDAWGQAMALNVLGRIDMAGGDMAAAREKFETSLRHATSQGERLGIVIAMNSRGWTRLLTGDVAGGEDDFAQSLDLSLALHHDEGIAYGLEAFVGLRALQGDAVAAGRLLGAAQTLRRRKGLVNLGSFEFYMIPLGALRTAGHSDELDRAIEEGHELTVSDVLEYVRS